MDALKIAITGANGFVGSNLTRYLMKQGYNVSALVRKTGNVALLPVKSKMVEVDYNNPDSIRAAFQGQNIIIHCAALTRAQNWEQMRETNVGLTEKLVNIANEIESINQFIYLSSQAAAGMSSKDRPRTEEDLPAPVTWYGKSKLMAEEIIKNRLLKEWTIIRPVSVYGPGDKDFMETFKMLKNHISVSLGLKDKYINLIYVDELTYFINLCIENKAALHQVFFAADGQIYTHKMFSDALQSAVNTFSLHFSVPDVLTFYAAALGELRNKIQPSSSILTLQKFKELTGRYWTVSIEKARRLLNFNPQPNLVQNLHKTWLWYKEQGWL
ncbi:MAG TPA: NAD-dependent epimerase/dehydratase family protein [Candidatus Cloacimonadota bacterium]|nr:NAD-dependent epimerase/dehydratase family protein [Candidatus Cloacimonadota bacterium]HQL15230.1 NAD-dependent epimerase/dehydratase family protein [Candidatus Cloacimonadota bacterium]